MLGYTAHFKCHSVVMIAARFYGGHLLSTYFLNIYNEIPPWQLVICIQVNESTDQYANAYT